MITIMADFNHLDGRGRLILSDLAVHAETPFESIAAAGAPILFIQGEDIVRGRLVRGASGWCGEVDWSTQEVLRQYPRPVLGRAS